MVRYNGRFFTYASSPVQRTRASRFKTPALVSIRLYL